MAHQDYRDCIDACEACAEECDHCASVCLHEPHAGEMARCIALDIECAQLCRLAVGAMARGSEFAMQICALCAEVCEACAEECERHAAEHCKACAEACRRCAEECRRMSGGRRRGAAEGASAGAH